MKFSLYVQCWGIAWCFSADCCSIWKCTSNHPAGDWVLKFRQVTSHVSTSWYGRHAIACPNNPSKYFDGLGRVLTWYVYDWLLLPHLVNTGWKINSNEDDHTHLLTKLTSLGQEQCTQQRVDSHEMFLTCSGVTWSNVVAVWSEQILLWDSSHAKWFKHINRKTIGLLIAQRLRESALMAWTMLLNWVRANSHDGLDIHYNNYYAWCILHHACTTVTHAQKLNRTIDCLGDLLQ